MSVLYPLTLRTNYALSKSRKSNSLIKFVLCFLITSISFSELFAQEVSKEEEARKEAELKRQEAAALEAKLKANPDMSGRFGVLNDKVTTVKLSDEEEKQLALKKQAAERAKVMAEKKSSSLPGVEYKVITTGNEVEYVITSAGKEIYRQAINLTGSVYQKQVIAEKEAIYASNTLRRNPNYPVDALKAEIRSLVNQPSSSGRQSNNSRVTADYTFNGGGGSIPGGAPTTTSGPASPYPATIAVSGVPAGALVKSVTISGMNHTYSDDIDIVLQSPTGVNVILMSDCGLGDNLVSHNYTFSDGAALSLNDNTALASGTYKPTNFVTGDNWPAPGPGTTPTSTTLSTFGGVNHNGTWNLFIYDDVGGDSGDWASWSITFTDPPAVCFPINLTGQPANTAICAGTNGSFTVVATPPGVTYNWQVNTGSGFTYLTNGGVYSGVNTATLSITGATLAMNGYQYRVVITCSDGGLPEISNPATLTVNVSPASPAVIPSTAAICPGGSQLLSAYINPTSFGGGPGVAIPGTGTGASTGAPGNPYPSTIAVAGLPAITVVKSVTINGLTHTFPADIDIVLRSPAGVNVILISDIASASLTNVNYTLDDGAVSLLSNSAANPSGIYRPTNYNTPDNWPAPGPGSLTQANPSLSSFGSGNNNGNWELYIVDDVGGDIGTIADWSITFAEPGAAIFSPAAGLFSDAGLTIPYIAGSAVNSVYASPAATTTYSVVVTNGTCNSIPTNVTVTVNQAPVITAHPANGTACVGVVKTLSVTATGTAVTYQWQVDMGSGFVNITTGTPTNPGGFIYTGQTTATLSINSVMATMNNYKYRCVVSGACPPALNSNEVTLTVNERPVVSVVSSAECSPTTLTASGADTYSWSPSAGLSATTGATVTANPTVNTIYTVTGTNTATGCTGTTQADVKFTPPTPVVAPATPIICAGAVRLLSITSSSSGLTLPNTTASGTVNLPFNDGPPPVIAVSNLTVAGVTGPIQSISVNLNIAHTYDGDITINLKAPNGNIYNLFAENGGGGDSLTNTTISSTATNSIVGGTAPYTGTYAAEGASGAGLAPNLSNVTAWASLYSTPNGTWSLICTDPYALDNGTLKSWSITINYAIPDEGIWTPVTGLFTNAAGTTPYVAGTLADTVYASPAATTTYSVTVTNTSTPTKTFSSGGSVTIPAIVFGSTSTGGGAGAPYPSTLAVSGLPANATVKSVTVKGVRHSFPGDIDMLLQAPTGTNVVLMSDVGAGADATGQVYTFDDAGGAMSTTALNSTGTYLPTNNGETDTYPAPVGSITQASPALSMFTGDPNGIWNLYITDDTGGDVGLIYSWEITFSIPGPTNCTSPPRTVTVTVQAPIVFTTQPANRAACQNGSVTFTAAATGTITTTQWQVSTNSGTTWTDISGANTTSLTLTNVQPSQNGYRYRLALSNAGCGTVNSNAATLTVNPLPTVSLGLSPAGQTQLRPGMVTTVTVISSPAGASYQWFLNGVAEPSITGASYAVDAYHLGTYSVRVTDVNGCVSTTAGVTFTALPTSQLFVHPNPTRGAFYVTYYMPQLNTPVTLVVIDMMGRRIVERQAVTTAPYTRFDFSNSKLAAGVYIIEFRNPGGDRLAAGQLVVAR